MCIWESETVKQTKLDNAPYIQENETSTRLLKNVVSVGYLTLFHM